MLKLLENKPQNRTMKIMALVEVQRIIGLRNA
jgi:hypothetical protein